MNRAVNAAVTLTQEGGAGLKLRPSKLPSESVFHALRNGGISVDRHYIWCATSALWTTPFLLVLGFCSLEGFDQQLRCPFSFNFFRRPTSLFPAIYPLTMFHTLSLVAVPAALLLATLPGVSAHALVSDTRVVCPHNDCIVWYSLMTPE